MTIQQRQHRAKFKAKVPLEAIRGERTINELAAECGAEANMAKYLTAEAAWEAANACLDCHGSYGFATEFDVERKFCESRLYKTAPINNNLVLSYVGQHVLGLPRSY